MTPISPFFIPKSLLLQHPQSRGLGHVSQDTSYGRFPLGELSSGVGEGAVAAEPPTELPVPPRTAWLRLRFASFHPAITPSSPFLF